MKSKEIFLSEIFIKDGNLKEWLRILLVIAGIFFVALGIIVKLSTIFGIFIFLIGFFLAAIGGYAAQAHTLKIKPFDNTYKKAKESYKRNPEK